MRPIRELNFLCFDKFKQTSWGYQGEWWASKFESKVKDSPAMSISPVKDEHEHLLMVQHTTKRGKERTTCTLNTHDITCD